MTYLRAFTMRNETRIALVTCAFVSLTARRCISLLLSLSSIIKMMTALAVVMVVTSVILFETDKMSGLRIAHLTLSCLQSFALVSGSPSAKMLVTRQYALA